jgi:hypothetical protein
MKRPRYRTRSRMAAAISVRQVRLSIYEHTHLLLIGFSIARPLKLPRGQHLVTLTPKREQQSAGTPQIDRECDDQADQEA